MLLQSFSFNNNNNKPRLEQDL